MFADRMGDLQTHRRQPPPLSQHFLHFFPKVAAYVKGFIVGVDIRVSGDADTNLFIDGVVIENLVHKFQYDVFHTDVAPVSYTHLDVYKRQKDGYEADIVLSVGSRENLEEVGANLFKVLRKFDFLEADTVYAEVFPLEGEGLAIMNRLQKSAGYRFIEAKGEEK